MWKLWKTKLSVWEREEVVRREEEKKMMVEMRGRGGSMKSNRGSCMKSSIG
jgi:hypothetical protein